MQHNQRAHALLSASGSSRWMKCTPSAKFEDQFPEKESEFALEGTFAHELSELLLQFRLGWITEYKFKDELLKFTANKFYCAELRMFCDGYVGYVIEQFAEAQAVDKNAVILIEERFDLSYIIPEGFCTSDVTIYTNGYGHTIDLKFGKGVAVSAGNSPQLNIYSLGGLKEAQMMFPIDRWKQTIYQPRIDNISHNEISVLELELWAEMELKPLAKTAFAGEGSFVPGDHCRFCRAKVFCKANAAMNMEVLKYDFAPANVLQPFEIADMLARTPNLINWANAIEKYALEEARNGFQWPGFKLVKGRSNRSYTDPAEIEKTLIRKGFLKEEIYKPFEILRITALESAIGKPVFAELISEFVVKAPGAPTLVPESDKRPAIQGTGKAVADFADVPTAEFFE